MNQLVTGIALLIAFACAPLAAFVAPTAQASAVFEQHSAALDRRLAWQHRSPETFVVLTTDERARLRRGEILIEALTPKDADVSGAMLHHWRGSAFVAGARAQINIVSLTTMRQHLRIAYFTAQISALMMGSIALLGVFLAGVGLYGVIS